MFNGFLMGFNGVKMSLLWSPNEAISGIAANRK